MTEPDGSTTESKNIETPKAAENATESPETPKDEKAKEPEIAIKQVPMDGICGGY
jgi:hypothetical protein